MGGAGWFLLGMWVLILLDGLAAAGGRRRR